MYTYASSYISGLNKFVEKWIKKDIADIKILKNLDGLIVYKTNNTNINLPYTNNDFLVLDFQNNLGGGTFNKQLQHFVKNIKINYNVIRSILPFNKSFKILTFDKNQPTKINYQIIETLEKSIQNNTQLKLGKSKHDIDIQIVNRSEGLMFCLIKLNNHKLNEKQIKQGSLKPELAYSLARIAEVKESDIVMDMFCGSGAIPKSIVRNFKYNMIFASDIDEEKTNPLKKEYKNNNKKLYIKQRDALDLNYFENDFIDKIITDPPWNIYNKQDIAFVDFYKVMLNEMSRILKPNGKAVVLMGNIEEFEQAINSVKTLNIENKYNILVNGKKANIYILKK